MERQKIKNRISIKIRHNIIKMKMLYVTIHFFFVLFCFFLMIYKKLKKLFLFLFANCGSDDILKEEEKEILHRMIFLTHSVAARLQMKKKGAWTWLRSWK